LSLPGLGIASAPGVGTDSTSQMMPTARQGGMRYRAPEHHPRHRDMDAGPVRMSAALSPPWPGRPWPASAACCPDGA